jgi:hypothetical protein
MLGAIHVSLDGETQGVFLDACGLQSLLSSVLCFQTATADSRQQAAGSRQQATKRRESRRGAGSKQWAGQPLADQQTEQTADRGQGTADNRQQTTADNGEQTADSR